MESQRNQREILPCPYSEPERISARRVHFHGYTPWHSGRYKTQDSLLYFSDGPLLLRTPSNDVRLEAPRLKWRRYPSYDIDGTSWMAVSHELNETPLSLTLLLKASEYTKYQSSFYLLALIVSLGLFVIWLLLSASLHRWVLHPVHMLTHALEQLRGGDLKVRIPDDAMLDEFRKMTTAFNDMVEEIDDLKIANYEKQLARQKLEALYLKQQITPHFMINCLNTIYQLTENNHADLARQMLQNLSVHLRYTLSSGQTVSLLEELNLVKTTWSFPPSAIPARCACSLPAKNRCKMQRLCRLYS